jgi:methylase of polypeptide subunit release factors
MNKTINASNNETDIDRDDDSKNTNDDIFNDIDHMRDYNKHENKNSRNEFNKNNVLFNESRNLFNKDGCLVLEIGSGQENSVKKIFAKLSFLKFIKGVHDHKGITRCLIYQYHTHI